MSTGDQKVDIFLKKFLPQQQITENFFDFLEKFIKDNTKRNYPVQGVIKPNTIITNILSSDTVDTFDIVTPFEGTDSVGNDIILDPLDANNIPFENTVAILYFVGLRFNRLFRDTEINVRTGKIKYTFFEDAVGELAEPDVVVDDGDETLTITVDSVCEANVSHAGRKAIVFLKQAVSQSLAFEEVDVIFTGGVNIIETLTALGQQLGSISTTASDYQVFLKGPTVRRNTDLRLDPNIMFAGIITGVGSGGSPSVFDESDVNDLSQSIGSLTGLFFAEHDPADGTHTDITPETITTETLTTGVQLDTRVNAADEDSPDVPVVHAIFQSGGGSGVQSIKWQIRDSSGQAIAFIDAHGNAYFQNLAAVTSILQQNLTVTGDTNLDGNMNFGDSLASDVATFNSKLRSFTDFHMLIDADNDDTGSAFRYFLHDFSTEIFRFEEDGDLAIKAALFNLDLDSANTLTGEAFTITKNNQASVLWALNEFGDTTATRDATTAAKTAYALADGTVISVDASLNEAYDRTLFRNLFQPTANAVNDRLINITAGTITLADGSLFALHDGKSLSAYTGGTANFNTGAVTGGGANFTVIDFTGQASQWAKYSSNLLSDDTIIILPAIGFGATQAAAPEPPLAKGALASFVVAVQDDGAAGVGTIENISESNFTRLPASGGGTGGGVADIITRFDDFLADGIFEFGFVSDFSEDDDDKIAIKVGATFDLVNSLIVFPSSSDSITTIDLIDPDFFPFERDIVDFHVLGFYDPDNVDSVPIFEISRDNAIHFTTVEVSITKDVVEGFGLFERERDPVLDEFTPVTSTFELTDLAGGDTARAQEFVLSDNSIITDVKLNLDRIGSPVGNARLLLLEDDGTGLPSANIIRQGAFFDISALAAGLVTLSINVEKLSGTYHIAVETDAAYKASFSTGVDAIRARGETSGAVPEASTFDGSIWTVATGTKLAYETNYQQLSFQLIVDFDITLDDAQLVLNTTTQQQVGQAFALTGNSNVLQRVKVKINKTGTPSGFLKYQIIKDDSGAPSTAPGDILSEANFLDITTLSAGINTVTLDITDLPKVPGTYHIVITTDAVYKGIFVGGVTEIGVRVDTTSPPSPLARTFNGTVWSAEIASTKVGFEILGRPLVLQLKITAGDAGSKLAGFATAYDLNAALNVGDNLENETQFLDVSGGGLSKITVLTFTPEQKRLIVIDVVTGKTHRAGTAFTISGNDLIFDPPLTGSGITQFDIFHIGKGTFDFSDRNRKLMGENGLGSLDPSLDLSSPGKGIQLRATDDKLYELVIKPGGVGVDIFLLTP